MDAVPLAWSEFSWWRPRDPDALEWRTGRLFGQAPRDVRAMVPTVGQMPYLGDVSRRWADRWVVYRPLTQEPALFRDFADLEPDEPSFSGFAQTFGPLGLPYETTFSEGEQPRPAESFRGWLREWELLRGVVLLLTLISRSRYEALADRIGLDPDGAVLKSPDEARLLPLRGPSPPTTIASRDLHPQLWEEAAGIPSAARRRVHLARGWIQATVNTQLEMHGGLHPLLVRAVGLEGRLHFRAVPRSLAQALWFQCAQAIDERRDFKRCANCPKWMLIAPFHAGGRRTSAKFCSDLCRLQDWRKPEPKRPQKRKTKRRPR